MFARLTLGAARLLDVHIQPSGTSAQHIEDEENTLVVDLNALRVLLPSFPDNAWCGIASACGKAVTPMCMKMRQILTSDLDNISQLLLDLEDSNANVLLPVALLKHPTDECASNSDLQSIETSSRLLRKCRRSSHSTMPILISSTHPSAPTIIITPSPFQPREKSCQIPLQDQAFGNLLTVSSYPVFNKIHPPMILESSSLPRLENWKWENGHWQAVLPTLQEQMKKRLCSRPLTTKKKAYRSPAIRHINAAIQMI